MKKVRQVLREIINGCSISFCDSIVGFKNGSFYESHMGLNATATTHVFVSTNISAFSAGRYVQAGWR